MRGTTAQTETERTNALKQSDCLAEVAQGWHQETVVQRYEGDDADGVEQGKGGRRDLDLATKEPPVHLCPLLHEEAAHLRSREVGGWGSHKKR